MNRPDYLSKYKFDWEMIDVVIGGQSVIDASRFFGKVSGDDSIQIFLDGYGINNIDPISATNSSKAYSFVCDPNLLRLVLILLVRDSRPEECVSS